MRPFKTYHKRTRSGIKKLSTDKTQLLIPTTPNSPKKPPPAMSTSSKTPFRIPQSRKIPKEPSIIDSTNTPIIYPTRTLSTGLTIDGDLVNKILDMTHNEQIDMLEWHEAAIKAKPRRVHWVAGVDQEELISILCACLQVRRDFMVLVVDVDSIEIQWTKKAQGALLEAVQGNFGR